MNQLFKRLSLVFVVTMGVTAGGQAYAQGTESLLTSLLQKVQGQLALSLAEAKCNFLDAVSFECSYQIEEVSLPPLGNSEGAAPEIYKDRGPGKEGILLELKVLPGKMEEALVPAIIASPHWQVYNNTYPVAQGRVQFSLKYGADVDPGLIDRLIQAVESEVQSADAP